MVVRRLLRAQLSPDTTSKSSQHVVRRTVVRRLLTHARHKLSASQFDRPCLVAALGINHPQPGSAMAAVPLLSA